MGNKYICQYCGKDTLNVDYDYLVGTNHLACQLEQDMKDVTEYRKDNPIEKCVMCGKDTAYRLNEHIDMRYGYVEGAGQMCKSCYDRGTERRQILVSADVVYNTPNDTELGAKVRRIYWETLE